MSIGATEFGGVAAVVLLMTNSGTTMFTSNGNGNGNGNEQMTDTEKLIKELEQQIVELRREVPLPTQQPSVCPHCGRCPTCGRSYSGLPPYYFYYPHPGYTWAVSYSSASEATPSTVDVVRGDE